MRCWRIHLFLIQNGSFPQSWLTGIFIDKATEPCNVPYFVTIISSWTTLQNLIVKVGFEQSVNMNFEISVLTTVSCVP